MSKLGVGDKVVCVGCRTDGTRLPSYGKKGYIMAVTHKGYRVMFNDNTQNILFFKDIVLLNETVESKYKTVLAYTLQELSAQVNKEIRDEWWPIGGIITYKLMKDQDCFVQAMVKE